MDQATQPFVALSSIKPGAKARIYSEKEWEAQKSNFEQLYKENPLKITMVAMQRDHGFIATERQYKRKIEKWGLDKNAKGNEMLVIAAQQVKRKLETGKDSTFSVRDREVKEDKIKRYIKRRMIRHSDLILHEVPAIVEKNTFITCHTPPNENIGCLPSAVLAHSSHMEVYAYSDISKDTCEIADAIGSRPPKNNTVLSTSNSLVGQATLPVADIRNERYKIFSDNLGFFEYPRDLDQVYPCNTITELFDETLIDAIKGKSREEEHRQLIMELEVQHGRTHSNVMYAVINLVIFQIHQARHKSAAKIIWHVADARRAMLDKLCGCSLEAIDVILTLFSAQGGSSNGQQLLEFMLERFSPVSSLPGKIPPRSSVLARFRNAESLLVRIDEIRKAAMFHKECLRFKYGESAETRDDLRSLNSIFLALDDLGITAVAAVLFAEGFVLEMEGINAPRGTSQNIASGVKGTYTQKIPFGAWADLKCSILY